MKEAPEFSGASFICDKVRICYFLVTVAVPYL
jgi:hypothetical protein